MEWLSFNRRRFLGSAALAAIAAPVLARAENARLFGIVLPEQLTELLPDEALGYAGIAERLIAFENYADRRRLPATPLKFDGGLPLSDLAGSLYRSAMPRLVALIDRSERIDPVFANKVGGLLAELHQTQFVVGTALAAAPNGFGNTPLTAVPHLEDGPLLGSPTGRALADDDGDSSDFVPPPAAATPYVFSPPEKDAEPIPVNVVVEAPPPKLVTPAAPPPMIRARDYARLAPEYARMFADLTTRDVYADSIKWHLTMLRESRPKYEGVSKQTGVPWHFIGVIHALEASFNFRAHLHNGDHPLSQRTRQVPSGRPLTWLPPADWESSAKDALQLLGFTGKTDWSLERTLYRLEAYNGFGYRGIGVPSPYLWSFSDHYTAGKFVADGKFNAKAKSQQCGTAVMLKMLADSGDIVLTTAI